MAWLAGQPSTPGSAGPQAAVLRQSGTLSEF